MGSSDLIPREVFGSHVLTIHSYTKTRGLIYGDFITAGTFAAAGHDWSILYYPNGDFSKENDWISLYLELHRPTTTHGGAAAVKARFRFSLLGADGQPVPGYSKGSDAGACSKVFVPMTTKQGIRKFVKRDALAWNSRSLVPNNCLSVRCDITVLNMTYNLQAQDDDGGACPRGRPAAPAAERFVVVPPPSVDRDLDRLLESGKGADVAFEVAAETFAAHRSVLAARSPVFMFELFGPMEDMAAAGRVHVVHDMEAWVFRALLHFVYTDATPPEMDRGGEAAMVMSQRLLVAADRYNLERLKLICEDNLCDYIETSTVGTILTLAEQHRCPGLRKACFQFLTSGNNLKAAMQTDGFDHLANSCPSVLKELLSKQLTIG